ncbi:hypothetical protein FQN57_003075 [Myotisia sp. PD_48]|nr:hypothetical protein FQN57_003075 [Myotisia sp. PD_48]
MNPHQQNKIDFNSLSPDEQRLLRLYGKIPNKKDLLQNKLKERKYFDSGDYALSKAGKASDVGVTSIGSRHPLPENIPHLTATSPPQGNSLPNHFYGHSPSHSSPHSGPATSNRSPVKDTRYLQQTTSADDGKGGEADITGTEEESQQKDSVGVPDLVSEQTIESPKSSYIHEGELPIRR